MNLHGYYWPQRGTKQVAYVDGQGHVIELFVAMRFPLTMKLFFFYSRLLDSLRLLDRHDWRN